MTTPEQMLREIPSMPERVGLVAQDLASHADAFAAIDPEELAALLGVRLAEGDWIQTAYAPRDSESLDEDEDEVADGAGWVVARRSLRVEDGTELMFEAEIGDGGDCFGFYGPYQIRDGDGAQTDGLVEGETW